MKILFLDVDGVLNRNSTKRGAEGVRDCALKTHGGAELTGVVEIAKVRALGAAVQACGAKIVVSSSWRNHAFASGAEFAVTIGLSAPDLLHRDWRTGKKPSSWRLHEIGWWLDDHRKVRDYAILDDHDLFVGGVDRPEMEGRLVRTDSDVGLVNEDLAAVVTLLGRADLAARDWFAAPGVAL